MKHEEIKKRILALFDGPLTEEERSLVEDHLPSCAECRQDIAQWKALSARLFSKHTFSEAEEDQFVSRTMERIAGLPTRAAVLSWGNAFRWFLPLAGSAVAAVWVLFSVLPATPGLSARSADENDLYASSTENPSYQWSIVPAAYSSDDMVSNLLKKE